MLLASPTAWDGMTLWLFGVAPGFDSDLAKADFPGWLYLAAVLATMGLALAATLRRFVKVTT